MRLFFAVALLVSLTLPQAARAQQKMDLDDLKIKGELHSDERLKILARQKNPLKNYVKFRTNYRKDIIEGLAKPQPKQKYYGLWEDPESRLFALGFDFM